MILLRFNQHEVNSNRESSSTAEVRHVNFHHFHTGPSIFVNPDSKSNIELGTYDNPFMSMDDAFKELFNRQSAYSASGNQFYKVTIFLKAGSNL